MDGKILASSLSSPGSLPVPPSPAHQRLIAQQSWSISGAGSMRAK